MGWGIGVLRRAHLRVYHVRAKHYKEIPRAKERTACQIQDLNPDQPVLTVIFMDVGQVTHAKVNDRLLGQGATLGMCKLRTCTGPPRQYILKIEKKDVADGSVVEKYCLFFFC